VRLIERPARAPSRPCTFVSLACLAAARSRVGNSERSLASAALSPLACASPAADCIGEREPSEREVEERLLAGLDSGIGTLGRAVAR
jgi:hypothetical protein